MSDATPLPDDDGRQSETALEIARGAGRCLLTHGFSVLPEVTVASGRRADLMAVNGRGEVWIVEIKSSVQDFRTDAKWPEYRDFCDQFYFAVKPDFPNTILPVDAGLILADRYGGERIRTPQAHSLSAARRKSVLITFGVVAARRLHTFADPAAFTEPRA
jgi:hypothetical protein